MGTFLGVLVIVAILAFVISFVRREGKLKAEGKPTALEKLRAYRKDPEGYWLAEKREREKAVAAAFAQGGLMMELEIEEAKLTGELTPENADAWLTQRRREIARDAGLPQPN
jgi:hypothetical protein